MRIAHVVPSLNVGGAEMMLCNLVAELAGKGCESVVVSLTQEGPLAAQLKMHGARVITLGMKRGQPHPVGAWRLAQELEKCQPQVIHAWMYHASLLSSIAAFRMRATPMVWGLHSNNAEAQHMKALTRATRKACAVLSHRWASAVVCCSEDAQRVHQRLGFSVRRLTTIPNGFDTRRYSNGSAERADVRDELGISADSFVVGVPARFHPLKDHECLAAAASLMRGVERPVKFVLCGSGIEWGNAALVGLLRRYGVEHNVLLLGVRSDLERIYPAMDVVTLSSSSEAFPMVLGEAMSCGVPCVTTDVGDAARIVGATGIVVPAGSPEQLAGGWKSVLSWSKGEYAMRSLQARERIVANYSLQAVADRYLALYEGLLLQNRAPRGARSS